MESPKKQNLSWDEIVARSREESPPAINVRPHVRARLEALLRSRSSAIRETPTGALDAILDLFSRPWARITLGACFGVAALLTLLTTASVEISDLTDRETDYTENLDETLVREDWTQYL
jgi:hypothetical protein